MSIEEIIKQAYRDGTFDDLEGAGKPLDLDENPFVPKELRLQYKILQNAGYAPDEVRMLKRQSELSTELDGCDDPVRQRAIRVEISQLDSLLRAKLARLQDNPA